MLTYFAHGVTLTLSWFLVTNLVISVLVAWSPARATARIDSSTLWFALRMAPAAISLAFVAAAFVPSYWRFEPRETVEGFDVTLTVCAIAAATMLGLGIARGVTAWTAVRRRTRDWLRTATPLSASHGGVDIFAVDSPEPLMALAGIVRPRVFVSARLIAALTADEFAATLEHELSHWRTRDNVKRLAMRMAPDCLAGTASARAIERRWAAAAEHAADDRGAGHDASARCTLASALVKVARLMPQSAPAFEPISTLVGGGELASRVRRLLDEPAPVAVARSRSRIAAAMAVAGGVAVAYGPLLHAIHEATEILVNRLP